MTHTDGSVATEDCATSEDEHQRRKGVFTKAVALRWMKRFPAEAVALLKQDGVLIPLECRNCGIRPDEVMPVSRSAPPVAEPCSVTAGPHAYICAVVLPVGEATDG